MKKRYKVILIAAAARVVAAFSLGLASCGARQTSLPATTDEERQEIENTLNLAKNQEVTWSYDSQSDSWTMSVASAVANPELADYQGVSVNVPGAYIKGVDTDGYGGSCMDTYRYGCIGRGYVLVFFYEYADRLDEQWDRC